MISLIFTCKVNNNKRRITSAITSATYTPIPYPTLDNTFEESSFDILLKCIRSYANFAFKSAVFCVEIESDEDVSAKLYDELISEIYRSINSENIVFKKRRPDSKRDWLIFIDECTSIVDAEPVLVSMNHDHLMVDENKCFLKDLVDKIFSDAPNSLLTYSHIPEAVAWGLTGLKRGKFNKIDGGCYRLSKTKSSNWVDCIYIMNINMLRYIFESIRSAPVYLPRFDWPGVSFDVMKLECVVVPISFLRHYDGYGHVTGIRPDRLLSNETRISLASTNAFCDSAYREFLENFFIYFRDALLDCKLYGSKRRRYFIKIVEQSFDFYLKGNLFFKYRDCMTADEINSLNEQIRRIFYYDINLIYNVVQEDAHLNDGTGLVRFFKRLVKKWFH